MVSAQGDITLAESPDFHQSLLNLCNESPRHLIVDLTGVNYMDSSGVGTLVDVYRKVRSKKGKMTLVGLSDAVRSLFEITKLDTFFSIVNSRQEALDP